jgi:predicted cupin superfamily sugar epimerase
MATPPPSHIVNISPRARSLISSLRLSYLTHESGYIGILGASPQTVTTSSGILLAAQSHNYYMLTSVLDVNHLHWLESDDVHVLVEGGPVEYFVFYPDDRVERKVLGRDFEKGQTAVVAVPGGCWKSLRLCEGVDFALMANVLCPEFRVDRVRIGEGAEWLKRYQGKADWATEEFLRQLIGPNWRAEGVAQVDQQANGRPGEG